MLMTYSFLLKEKAQIFIFFPKGKSSIVVMIRSIVFARPTLSRPGVGLNKGLWNDALLCRRLRRLTGDEVPTVHALTEAVRFFQSYRATGAWLRMRKAEGSISARALSLLLTLMNK